ncbi:MAG TPA: hypothetical protein VHZ74_03020 [Bryobacteraceae bacterium]|nr:hypothetical protein [Bryobacteraceae bacterium]
MSKQFFKWMATGVAVVAMTVPAFAQGRGSRGPKPPEGPTPRLADGKPDFSGVWARPYTPDMARESRDFKGGGLFRDLPNMAKDQKGLVALPFTPLGEKQWLAYDPANGDYTGSCMPFGLVRSVNSPDPLQIMQNSKYVGFLWEQNTWFHIAKFSPTHSKSTTPTWFGDTIASWDGDTLVLDTVNFNGRTRLDTIGHPHSDKLHVIERYTRTDLGHIAYEITIDDPVTYTKPWKNDRTFTLRPDWEIMEYSCEENNKDFFEGHIKATQDGAKAAESK